MSCPLGFRIVGPTWERRQLVSAADAFRGYACCDKRVDLACETYLSAYQFGDDFRLHLHETDSCAGFTGRTWSPWLWWDVDVEDDLQAALDHTRRLACTLLERYSEVGEDDLLLFLSGGKGFHSGLPITFARPAPSVTFHVAARRLAERVAALAGVPIDCGVYDRVRPFRAPNTRHPKTGLYKRRLSHDELMGLSLARIVQLASAPEPFELPTPTGTSDRMRQDWAAAAQEASQRAVAKGRPGDRMARLNRQTLQFIRDGAGQGDRHRLLYSAARNLGEYGCTFELAWAILADIALDCGLPPKEVRRQILCGLKDSGAAPRGIHHEPSELRHRR